MNNIRIDSDGMTVIAVIMIWFFMITIFFVGIVGYIKNIIHLLAFAGDPINMIEILRVVGVFMAPLGVIMGWMY